MAEKKCLITTSLISSVKWTFEAPNVIIKPERGGDGKITWSEKAKADLRNTLFRVWSEPSKEIRWGMTFENKVYELANRETLVGSKEFQEVCNAVKGYEYQKKIGKEFQIGEDLCYLYGKFDAINEDTKMIKDIKTTGKYTYGKYLKGTQHKMYCLLAGEDYNDFDYVVAEWQEYPTIKRVHTESFTVQDRDLMKEDLFREVSECLDGIRSLGLWEVYKDKFCLY